MTRAIVNRKGKTILEYSYIQELPVYGSILTVKNKKYRVVGFDYNFDSNVVVIKVVGY